MPRLELRVDGIPLSKKKDKKHPPLPYSFCVLRKTYAHEILQFSTYDEDSQSK